MTFRCAFIAASILFGSPILAHANTVNTQALELASQKQYSQALSLLSAQPQLEQTKYEHRFLKARILSWSGDYTSARRELNSLLVEHPGNPDVQLVLGNVEFYQGNLDAAEAQYTKVITKYPNYTDARTGLANVQKARANGPKKWRIDGGIGGSNFDESEIPEWDDQFLRVEYTPGPFSYHGSIQRYRRFGNTDVQFKAGIADAQKGGWDWGLEAGITPSGDFRPNFSLGGRLGHAIETESGLVLYPTTSYRFDEYSTGDIHTIQPELTAYLESGTILTGRLIGTFQEVGDDNVGWLIEGRQPVTDRLQLRAGYAQAPEDINGFAITTKSLFGGVTYSVRDDLDLHLNLSRDDREDSFVRESANVSFTYKR